LLHRFTAEFAHIHRFHPRRAESQSAQVSVLVRAAEFWLNTDAAGASRKMSGAVSGSSPFRSSPRRRRGADVQVFEDLADDA